MNLPLTLLFPSYSLRIVGPREEFAKVRIDPTINGIAVVLLGSFNPSIFTPAWFGWNGLLSEGTVSVAELRMAQPQATVFKADWLELQVLPDRFTITSSQPPFVRVMDLTIRLFGEKLPHTPIHSLGINRQVHFLLNNYQERDRIGRLLAPTGPWGAWGRQLEPDGKHGGMTSLTMAQVNLGDRSPAGRLSVTVEPSTRIGLDGTGAFVQVNDHYAIEDVTSPTATSDIIGILERNFEASIQWADQIVDQVMSLREG